MTWEQIGELAAMGTALLWTLSALAWTSAGRQVGALSVSFVRLGITCLFLIAYGQLVRGSWLAADVTREAWLVLGISGFFGFFQADLCLFKAFLLIGPRLSLLIQSLVPPLTALMAWFFLHDDLGLRHWLAMGVTLAGVAWVVLEQPETAAQPDGAQPHAHRHKGWGVFLALLAAIGQAVGTVLSKQGIGECDAVDATFIRVIGGLAGYVVLTTLWGRWAAVGSATRHARAMVLLTVGSLVGPFVGVVLYLIALRHCHAGVVATLIATMPVIILPFVIVLFKEKVSLRAAGGAIVSLVGVALLVL